MSVATVFPQIALAIGVLTSNRRGGWLPTLAGFTLGAMLGCHCWVPLGAIAGVPWLDAIAGCHCWMLATNFGGVHVGRHCCVQLLGCHCWVSLWGAMAGCHCWGAIAGCHCGVPWLDAIAGCHCWVPLLDASDQLWRSSRWVPLLGAMLRCHCWVPLREKIDQSVTPFSAAPFSTLITHKLVCAISGLCWYNFYCTL